MKCGTLCLWVAREMWSGQVTIRYMKSGSVELLLFTLQKRPGAGRWETRTLKVLKLHFTVLIIAESNCSWWWWLVS